MTAEQQQTPDETAQAPNKIWSWIITSILLFWVGYLAITLVTGVATSTTIGSEVLRHTVWGFVASAGLIAWSRFMMRVEKGRRTTLDLSLSKSSLSKFSLGVLLGVVSFGVHAAVIATFAGPIRFEWVPGVGVAAVTIYFARFLATSCMEELGFRGYALRRLTLVMGSWPAVWITAVVFGLSHLSYGWDLRTIALGVVPGGLLWGMSALATGGIAVPIGLHAAWNFAGWAAGHRAEVGLLQIIVEDDAVQRTQQVSSASYWLIFGGLTVAFWLLHRRNVQRAAVSPDSPGPKS